MHQVLPIGSGGFWADRRSRYSIQTRRIESAGGRIILDNTATMEFLGLSIIGFFVGLAGGLFGIGGGIVLIPALTIFAGPNQHQYQAVALIVNVFVSVPAVYQHMRARAIDRRTVARLIPPAILAVIAGVALSEAPIFTDSGEPRLRLCFAAFLLFAAVAEGYRMAVPFRSKNGPLNPVTDDAHHDRPMGHARTAAIALSTGLVSGLLGLGGGVVAVPLQRRFLHIPLRNAIANSAAVIIAVSLVGALVKNFAYASAHGRSKDAIVLALLVGPAAVAGSLVGSRLTHRLPIGRLRVLFIGLLIVAAIRMAAGSIRAIL